MTDERWEELMRQVGGLLQREDVDCAYRILQEMLDEQVRLRRPEDSTAAATRLVLALFVHRMGRLDEARKLMEMAEAVLLKQGELMLLASCLRWRAEMAAAEGDLAGAEPLYRRCLQIMQSADDAERAEIMHCQLQLAKVLRHLRQADAAIDLLHELSEAEDVSTQQETQVVAQAALMLGDHYVRMRRPVEATVPLSQAMQLHREQPVFEDAELAYLHFCTGRLASMERQFAAAERHYLDAIRLCGRERPPGSMLPGAAWLGLGNLRAAQCRWAEALECFERVLEDAQSREAKADLMEFGWGALGRVYLGLHRYEEAEDCLERAVEQAVQSKAPHGDLRALRHELARARQGTFTPPDQRGVQTADDILDQLGRDRGEGALRDPRYGSRLLDQATEQRKQSRWDRALSCFQAAQRIFEQAFGPEHEAIADCRYWQGLTLMAQGLAEPAEGAFREAMSIMGRIDRRGRIAPHQVLNGLGTLLMSQDRAAEARELLQRALQMAELEPAAQQVGLLMNLGIACDLCGQTQEAEGWHLRALSMLERDAPAGQHDPAVGHELANLANLYIRRGDYRMAEAVLKRSIDTLRPHLGENHPAVLKLRGQHECVAQRLRRSRKQAP